MQRFVLSSIVVLLGACASKSAPATVVPEAPALAEADPVAAPAESPAEGPVDPTQPQAEPVGPLATVTPPAATTEPVETPPATDAPALAGLIGEYRYRGGRQSATKSIEAVVNEMSALVRGIARTRLTEANRIPSKLSIAQTGDEVTVTIDGRAYTATLGGAAKSVKDANGEASRMRFQLRGAALYQLLDATDGDRTNVYTRRDDGGIDMAVRITSKRLPSDVRYKLSFKPAE